MLGDVPYKVVTTMVGEPPEWHEPKPRHCVLRIRSLATDQQWVIDLSGAQYGINDAVYTSEQYEAVFVREILDSAPIDYHKSKIARLAALEGGNRLAFGLPLQAAGKLEEAVESWEHRRQRIASLLSVDDAGFERLENDLLECVDAAVRSFVREGSFDGLVDEAYEYMRTHPDQMARETERILRTE